MVQQEWSDTRTMQGKWALGGGSWSVGVFGGVTSGELRTVDVVSQDVPLYRFQRSDGGRRKAIVWQPALTSEQTSIREIGGTGEHFSVERYPWMIAGLLSLAFGCSCNFKSSLYYSEAHR